MAICEICGEGPAREMVKDRDDQWILICLPCLDEEDPFGHINWRNGNWREIAE